MGIFQRMGASILALGVVIVGVVIVAPAASAHSNAVTGTAVCQQDGTYTVTWTITNDYKYAETVSYLDHMGGSAPTGLPADVAAFGSVGTVVTTGIASDATKATLKVKGFWQQDMFTTTNTGKVSLSGTCGDDDTTKKVDLCHATPPATAANGWNRINVSVSSVVGNNGHDDHAKDIIGPFTYKKNGTTHSYPGKNWDAAGQAIYHNGCVVPPPPPTCVDHIDAGDISAQYGSDPYHAVVTYTGDAKKLCADVEQTVSLNSYATDGPTWETSGTQVFVDHDSVTLSKDNRHGNLKVTAPSCYYQTDLYLGAIRFDGDQGALPHFPDVVTPEHLIDWRNGGRACVVTQPSGHLQAECDNGTAKVVASHLSGGTFTGVEWRLVTGTETDHSTVVPSTMNGDKLVATGVADNTKLWLQFKKTGHDWTDEGSAVTTGICTPPVVVIPTGHVYTDCYQDSAVVTAGGLDDGTYANVAWRLVTGAGHDTVVATQAGNGHLAAHDVAAGTTVYLQYNLDGTHTWTDAGNAKATAGNCVPTGTVATECVGDAGAVTATVNAHDATNVQWRLVTGTPADHHDVLTSQAQGSTLVAHGLADSTKVWLQYSVDGQVWKDVHDASVTTGTCTPAVVNPTGDFTTACTATGADVTLGTLSPGNRSGVVWTLTVNGAAQTVTSDQVVAVPAAATLALAYQVGGADAVVVRTRTAPAACPAPVKKGALGVIKTVDKSAAEIGDTLTYTLTVSATGEIVQRNVVVSDVLPGYRSGATSGKTTYVAGSAACDAGSCTPSYDDPTKRLTWALGDLAAGTSRTVTFKVTIDKPATLTDGGTPAITIVNSGAVQSTDTPEQPSNPVTTDVTQVEGTKQTATSTTTGSTTSTGTTPSSTTTSSTTTGSTNTGGSDETPSTPVEATTTGSVLPHTGAGFPVGLTTLVGGLLLALGTALTVAARRRPVPVRTD